MDMYNIQQMARIEHEQMVRSLAPVHDFDLRFQPEPSHWARLLATLRKIGAHLRPSPHIPHMPTRPSLTVNNPSSFLRDRIQEDSNHLTEWLWAASQVTDPEEIRYCLERVLYINPAHRETQRKISRLVARRAPTRNTILVDEQGVFQPISNS